MDNPEPQQLSSQEAVDACRKLHRIAAELRNGLELKDAIHKGCQMTVTDLILILQRIEKDGGSNLPVMFSLDEGDETHVINVEVRDAYDARASRLTQNPVVERAVILN